MADARDRIEDEAAAWVLRLRDASDADWESFTAWLEADPAHGEAYETMALADLELDDLPLSRPQPLVAPAPEPRRFGRRSFMGWGGAAIAAALVGAIALNMNGGSYEVVTGAGQRQVIALEDGSRIELNGATHLVLDEDNPRFARVERGEALFTVVHDEARPFRVEAGAARLTDLGTVFNVVHDGGRTDVAVAEGAVRWQRASAQVDLTAGMALSQRGEDAPVVTREAVAEIGGWRQGRLSYSSARYDAVAADLARNLGAAVAVDDTAAARRFSGVIVVDRDAGVTMERVGALLEVDARRRGDGWILAVENGAPR